MGKRVGPLSKEIRNLCYDLRDGRIDEPGFKDRLRQVLDEFKHLPKLHQNVGMAIQKWSRYPQRFDLRTSDNIWRLVDQVDSRIRPEYERWVDIMEK